MTVADVYMGLGANLGDREAQIGDALKALEQCSTLQAVSPIYETEPVGPADQPPFLNLACHLRTTLSPHALLSVIRNVEHTLGRRSGMPDGPRPIDIDILLYGKVTISDHELTIPHPRMAERAFVLVPLAQIAPDVQHPAAGATINDLLRRLQDTHWIREYYGGTYVHTVR